MCLSEVCQQWCSCGIPDFSTDNQIGALVTENDVPQRPNVASTVSPNKQSSPPSPQIMVFYFIINNITYIQLNFLNYASNSVNEVLKDTDVSYM